MPNGKNGTFFIKKNQVKKSKENQLKSFSDLNEEKIVEEPTIDPTPPMVVEEKIHTPLPVQEEQQNDLVDRQNRYLDEIKGFKSGPIFSKEEVSLSTRDMNEYVEAVKEVSEFNPNTTDIIEQELQNTPATLRDLRDWTKQVASNLQTSLTSLGGGGLGEKDVIKLIEERDLDSEEIQHIITILEGHYLDSQEGLELILDIVDSDYINLRVDHPPYDSATTISIIKEQVDSDYVDARLDLSTHSINELGDVDTSLASTNDILEYNGSEWQATNRTSAGVLNFKGVVDVTVENPPDSADLTIGDTYMASHSGTALTTWGHMQDGGDSVQTKDLFVWEPSDDPAKINAFEHLPATTDVGVVEVREGFGIDVIQDDPNRPTVLIDSAELATAFLPLTGGTITGDLNVSSIDNVSGGDPLMVKWNGNDRFAFQQSNTSYATLDMNSNKIINLSTPASNGDAANKLYVDQQVEGLGGDFVELTGDQSVGGQKTFTSSLYMSNYGYLSNSSSRSDGLLRRDTIESMVAGAGGGGDYKITKSGSNYYIEPN